MSTCTSLHPVSPALEKLPRGHAQQSAPGSAGKPPRGKNASISRYFKPEARGSPPAPLFAATTPVSNEAKENHFPPGSGGSLGVGPASDSKQSDVAVASLRANMGAAQREADDLRRQVARLEGEVASANRATASAHEDAAALKRRVDDAAEAAEAAAKRDAERAEATKRLARWCWLTSC